MKKAIFTLSMLFFLMTLSQAQENLSVEGTAKVDTLEISKLGDEVIGEIYSQGSYLTMGAKRTLIFDSGTEYPVFGNIHFRTPDAFYNSMSISGLGGVGIGDRPAPVEMLDVNGAIRIGMSRDNQSGTIRWTGSDFEGHNGTEWLSLSSGGTNNLIIDNDGDTKVELVEGVSDKINFNVNGSTVAQLDTNAYGSLRYQMYNPKFYSSLFIGEESGNINGLGADFGAQGFGNTGLGYRTLKNNSYGLYNTAIGSDALRDANASSNTAVGFFSLKSNTEGNFNTAVGALSNRDNLTGSLNTVSGYSALSNNESGSYNTVMGSFAGLLDTFSSNNVYIGYSAGATVGVGIQHETRKSVMVGSGAGYNSNSSSSVFLGYRAGSLETNDNRLYIHNNSGGPMNALIYGEFDNKYLRINGKVNIKRVLTLEPQSVVPGTPNIGDLYMDDGSNTGGTPTMRYWNGTSWIDIN